MHIFTPFRHARGFVLFLPALLVAACCHTNSLSDYTWNGDKLLFTYSVEPGATSVRLNINSPAPTNAVADILTGAGSDILSNEAQKKLDGAVRPDGIAASVTAGIEKVLTTQLMVKAGTRAENPDFIVETLLEECSIFSGSTGLGLHIKAQTEIIHRPSGRRVWRDCMSEDAVIRHTPLGGIPLPGVGTAASLYNAAEFFKLSEKEIQDHILAAAEETGRQLGQSLREDYGKSH
jgi:hypothetical protein